MSVDVAAERSRFRERQERLLEENRPRVVLRLAPPGAKLEDLRAIVDTHYPRLPAAERDALVQRVLQEQASSRGTRLDPATVAVSRPELEPTRLRKNARAAGIPDLAAWGTEESPAAEELDATTENEPAPAPAPAAEPESTVTMTKSKKGTGGAKRAFTREELARAIVWVALQLIAYPNTPKKQLYAQLAGAVGVNASPSIAHYKIGNPAVVLKQQAPALATAEDLLRLQYSIWEMPAPANLAEIAAAIPAPPVTAVATGGDAEAADVAEPSPAAAAEEVAPSPEPKVRCHGCGMLLRVGEDCSNDECRLAKVMNARKPVAAPHRNGSAPEPAPAAAPLETAAHAPVEAPAAPVEAPAAPVETPVERPAVREDLRGGGVLRTDRGVIRHQVRRDGTYTVALEITTQDAALFAQLVGIGFEGLLAEVAHG